MTFFFLVWMSEARRHIEPYSATFILVGCKWDLTQDGEDNGAEEHREVRSIFSSFERT